MCSRSAKDGMVMFNSSIIQRIKTATIIAAIAAIILYIGGWLMVAAILGLSVLMDKEWRNITPANHIGWQIAGIAYITLPCICALALRDLSIGALLFPIILLIATDSGAYFAGKTIGGAKLAPSISPNKTWAGLLGGITASVTIAILAKNIVPWPNTLISVITIGVMVAVFGQIGDLFESWLKRKQGVKDSGNLLPGHGGVLDRLDGYITVLPTYLLFLIIYAELA